MKWGTIVVLMILGWQVVGALMEQAARKKKAELVKAEAQRRQMAGRSGAGAPTETAGTTAQPSRPGGQTSEQRAQTLAERRKKQLEELRRRRAARTGGASVDITPTPTRAPAPPQTQTPSQVPPRIVVTSPTEMDQWRQQLEARRREALEKREEAKRQKRAAKKAAAAAPAQKTHGGSLVTSAEPVPERVLLHAQSKEKLLGRLRSAESLRELYLLKELLDPPVSLRAPDRDQLG